MTIEKIIELKQQNIKENTDVPTLNTEELVDIRDVKINTKLPKQERMKDFVKQIKNPYLFKCGKLTIQLEYEDNAKDLDDMLLEYIKAI